jgi:hypothetical protein
MKTGIRVVIKTTTGAMSNRIEFSSKAILNKCNNNKDRMLMEVKQGLQPGAISDKGSSESNASGGNCNKDGEISESSRGGLENRRDNSGSMMGYHTQGNGQFFSVNGQNFQQQWGQNVGYQGFGLGVFQNNFSQQQGGNYESDESGDWQQNWNSVFYQNYHNQRQAEVNMQMDPYLQATDSTDQRGRGANSGRGGSQ